MADFPLGCGCCDSGNTQCYLAGQEERQAIEILCKDGVTVWRDSVTGLPLALPLTPCVVPPEEIVVFNFPNGPVANPVTLQRLENIRAMLNAGFITPPPLFNGDQQIHIDVTVWNDPPFNGIPFSGPVGVGGPLTLRPDGTSYSGQLLLETAYTDIASETEVNNVILHELLHAFGIGTSNTWFGFLVNPFTNNAGYTGPQALAEYQAMAGGFPGAAFVPVTNDTFHWAEGGHDSGQDCLTNEVMSPFISGSGAFSRVTAATLRDLGYDYDVNSAVAFPCGGA